MGNSRRGNQRKGARPQGGVNRRVYQWDSNVLRTVSDSLLFIAIGMMVLLVAYAAGLEKLTLRNALLGGVLACFGAMELVRAMDNKQKGGDKKTTWLLIAFACTMIACGVLIFLVLEVF